MKLGIINENLNEGKRTLTGSLSTYSLNLEFRMEPASGRKTEQSPTHDIIARGKHGKGFHAGVAWQGRTKDGNDMFTMAVLIPELFEGEQRYCAWRRDAASFDITESKPMEQEQQAAA